MNPINTIKPNDQELGEDDLTQEVGIIVHKSDSDTEKTRKLFVMFWPLLLNLTERVNMREP